ncbi:efflux RND transporter permease subunit [Thermithiobacillus plumbiphilus]|uniref:Efflux RND transporter permease subunit n=1 Tax=Thermithiobacillus plumbiphilus TaxID=1729899 RepID=A0ABU9DB97_9PROT
MMGAWLQRHARSLLFLLAILAIGGALAAMKLPVSLFPTIDFPRIVVSVDAGDRPVNRMVLEVTQPLEQALRAVPGVESIRSTSSRGSAELSVNFGWGHDMIAALLQVQAAVNQSLPELPAGTRFEARRMDPTVFPVLGLALTSKQRDPVALRDFAYFQLRPLLTAIPGVARVDVLGGRQAEYQVRVDPARLQAYNLTLQDVATALSASNVLSAVGRLEDHYRLYLVLSDTSLHNLDEIRHTVLRTGGTGVVELDDVAQVVPAVAPQWTRVTANGLDAVLVNIRQQRGANTVAITQAVKQKLASFAHQIPADIQIKPYYDQSELVVASALSVRDAIGIGALLAAVILLLFLRNLRITLIVALVLPGVLAATVLLLNVLNMSFNIMTLGGMAAAVGLIVDDAVVMIEHIMRRLSESREDSGTPVLQAAMEMARPLAGSSLATVVIFAPLAFLGGVSGGFFKALALTMAASLIISFFVAFLAVPLLAHLWIKPETAARLEHRGPLLSRLHHGYGRGMGWLLRRPVLVLLPMLVLVGIGYFAFSHTGSGFMPKMDEGGFILDYKAPPGTSLTETDRLLRQVEAIVRATPEVDSYSRRTGTALGGGLTEANEGDFFIHLKPMPRRDIESIMSEVRQRVETEVPGLQIETAQLMEDLIGDLTAVPQPIEVKLFGDNQAQLQQLAPQIAASIGKVQGVVEVLSGVVIAGDAIDIRVDRVRAGLEGLDPEAATRQIKDLLAGNVASQIPAGEKMIGLRVWTPADLRARVQQLEGLRLQAPDGHVLPLSRIATVSISQGQAQIVREDLKPMVAVTARIEGRDLGSTMKDVQAGLRNFNLPAGVYIEYGGLYQQQQQSFRDLSVVFAAALLLVTVLLLFLYERFAVVLAILATVLLAVSGVFVGLWLTGTELNISAMMGMTMIIGIVTEVAIFYFAELGLEGHHDSPALIEAGTQRMRPILMTSLIAILALLPLALGIGTGSAMQTPLAIAIISGLLLAVPLVLLLMPALYLLMQGRQKPEAA